MCNNLCFKGFNNILCAFDIPIEKKRVTYFAMQLNNEGEDDLTQFKKLIEKQGLLSNQPDSDIVTLTHVVDTANKTENLYLGCKDMFFGDELLEIEKTIPKYMSQEKYNTEKDLHMKAYTQLASLTKRAWKKSIDWDDKDRLRVMDKLYNTLLSLRKMNSFVFNPEQVFELLNIGCLKRVKFQDVALFFNKGISHTMEKFFFPKL